MQTLRSFTPNDLEELERIHSRHYAHEFNLPDFLKYACAYIVEDEQGIITFGGMRYIPECVTVTNRDRRPSDRIRALKQVLSISEFVTVRNGHDQIYVWSQNPRWAKILKKHGFREPQGQSLILDL